MVEERIWKDAQCHRLFLLNHEVQKAQPNKKTLKFELHPQKSLSKQFWA